MNNFYDITNDKVCNECFNKKLKEMNLKLDELKKNLPTENYLVTYYQGSSEINELKRENKNGVYFKYLLNH